MQLVSIIYDYNLIFFLYNAKELTSMYRQLRQNYRKTRRPLLQEYL